MIEALKAFLRWDKIVEAVTSWLPHINRLVLGSLTIVAVVIIAIFVILFD